MFGFLIFITIVIYGMWVAQGVVAEKASRVMELLISAASTRQLVIGKALGIGLAGATQTTIVLAPALFVLATEDAIARLVLGQGVGFASSISSLSPGLLLAFAVFYVLGFALYSLDLRRGRLARQPARGPPDHRAAAEHRRDRRIRDGPAGADGRDHRASSGSLRTSRSGARS